MDKQLLTYWVDLKGISFSDSKPNAAWLQAFPVGEYSHPLYGKIKMTFERAKTMASNVIKNVRGIDIAIDYGHDSGGPAAGWVSSAEARPDGLWLFVEWTDEAAGDIREGKYRYFSPEYVDQWKHPESGTKFKDVLLGGGLTNRPFLKGIMPVNLSEVLGEDPNPTEQLEGGDMEKFLETLRKKFKLAEDASEDDILEALEEALQANTEEDTDEDPVESLTEEEVAKILEEHPALAGVLEQSKVLQEQNKTLAGRVVNLERTGRQTTVSTKLTEWHAGGEERKHGLPVALDEKLTSFMLSMDEAQAEAFSEIIDGLVKTGLVSLGETGARRKISSKGSSSVLSEVEDGIKKLMDDNEGMTYADASSQLFRDDEELYDKYLEELNEEVDA